MHNFALNKIEAATGEISFYELVVDEVRPFKEFRDQIRDNEVYMSQLKTVFATIARLSENNHRVSGSACHQLTNPVEGGVEYEIRTRDLRVYFFKHTNGKVIVLPGFKVNQKQDIVKFRSLKKEYIKSLSK